MTNFVRIHALTHYPRTLIHESLEPYDDRMEYEGLSEKFHKFLTRASNCRSIFDTQASSSFKTKRQIILLEDLPNILHPPTQRAFHESLQTLVSNTSPNIVPVVIVVSDAGVRGETGDDASASVGTWKAGARETVDFRSVIPPALWSSPYVTNISYVLFHQLTYMRMVHSCSSSQVQPYRAHAHETCTTVPPHYTFYQVFCTLKLCAAVEGDARPHRRVIEW